MTRQNGYREQLSSPVFAEIVFYILISAICTSVSIPAQTLDPNRPSAQKVDQSDLLWWLPPDTESVAVARGPFPLPAGSSPSADEESKKWFTARATLAQIRTAFEELPLEIVDGANLIEPFKGYTVAIAIQGTRHFREPEKGSEVTSYKGCSIVVFRERVDKMESKIRKASGWENAETESIGGTRVLVAQDKSDDAGETYFAASPLPDVLIIANDQRYLRDVLDRAKERSTLRAFPSELPEWRSLPNSARFWGLRHYDPTQAKMDPTSPLGGDTAYVQSDPQAIGVLFALAPDDERSLAIKYFSRDEAKAKAEAAKGRAVNEPQEGVKYELKLRNPSPGVFETIYTLDRSSTLDYAILAIEFALGRGMNF